MMKKKSSVAMVVILLVALSLMPRAAFAEEPGGATKFDGRPDASANVTDFRGQVVTAVGLMFTFIIGFLIISQLRGARMRDELEHLRRRVADLEQTRR